MKRIIAIIRPEKFEDVKRELVEAGCDGMTVSEVKGRGSQKGIRESYRGSNFCIDLIPKTRVEIVVNDDKLDLFIDRIIKGAYTGNIGDGKIFIQPIENVISLASNRKQSMIP